MAAIAKTLACCMTVMSLLFSFSMAKDILVGGSTHAWKVPSSQLDSLNLWARNTRFRIGDSLVWKYESGKDSVLQVTREAYLSCNATNPIKEHKDGNTVVLLDRPGPFYFISGADGHCEKGQKIIVVVLSPRYSASPAPSPSELEGPAVTPSSSSTSLKCGSMVVLAVLLLGLY